MATMNVSLPDQMKAWAESRTHDGQYANVSDYVRDLIRRDREKHDKIVALQEKITEGLESGLSDRSFEDILADAKQRALGKKPEPV